MSEMQRHPGIWENHPRLSPERIDECPLCEQMYLREKAEAQLSEAQAAREEATAEAQELATELAQERTLHQELREALFLFEDQLDFAAAVAAAQEHFPQVIKRFQFPILPTDPPAPEED